MRNRACLGPAMALASLLLLAGCTHGTAAGPGSRPGTASPPRLGAPAPAPVQAPSAPMNKLEKPVAARLAAQVADQGLSLSYLDCPRWSGRVPARMVCRAYLDGVVASVRVHLRAAVAGKAVGFDAALADGIIATRKLERTLRGQGWTSADCGTRAAYAAVVGTRIVCRVQRKAQERFLVARVTDRDGQVMIGAYQG